LQSFFQKRRSSRDSGAARQFTFFAKLSFLRKKAERGDRQTGFAGRQTAAPVVKRLRLTACLGGLSTA